MSTNFDHQRWKDVMGRISGKVAIVTGGARGQGGEHARPLAAEGATVVITDILDEQGMALAKEIANSGATAEYVSHDVSDNDGWNDLAAQTVEKFGVWRTLREPTQRPCE